MKTLSTPRSINVTGMFLPWRLDEDQPVLVQIEGSNCLPIYSTVAKLHGSMQELGIVEYRLKRIDDGREFVESIPLMVALDPYIHNGNTRFTKIVLPKQATQ